MSYQRQEVSMKLLEKTFWAKKIWRHFTCAGVFPFSATSYFYSTIFQREILYSLLCYTYFTAIVTQALHRSATRAAYI